MGTFKNTYDNLFPFTDKEIRFLAADASTLEVSKFDTHLSNHVAHRSIDLASRGKVTLTYALGRAYFLVTGKYLQPNE